MPARYLSLCVLGVSGLLGGVRPAAGQPVGSEFQVNTYTTREQYQPAVASDGTGRFVVVWASYRQDGSSAGVFGQRFNREGEPAGGEFRANTYTPGGQSDPAVASDSNGNFVVVWSSYRQDGSGDGIFGQRYDRHGAKRGSEFRVNGVTAGSQSYPAVASDPAGGFVVVWETPANSGEDIHGQRYDATGAPQGGEFTVNSFTSGFQQRPSVASDANGNFVVAWISQGSLYESARIHAQRFDSQGQSAGPELHVSSHPSSQLFPSVASEPSGDFVVVWERYQYEFGGDAIFGRRFDSSGQPQGDEFRVDAEDAGFAENPSVAKDASGSFVVAWHGYTYGSYREVFARRYDSAGVPHGGNFLVNTYTSSDQENPAIATTSDGRFVVVWESQAQDGSFDGVFGQRIGFVPGDVEE